MASPRHRSSGFTLIELMIIIGIFGVLIAIGVPTMRGFIRTTRMRGAQDTMLGDIRNARALATAHRRTHQILCNGSGYTIYQIEPRGHRPQAAAAARRDGDLHGHVDLLRLGLTRPVSVILRDSAVQETLQVMASGVVQ